MRLDFQVLRDTTPIMEVVKLLDITLQDKGYQFKGDCPISGYTNANSPTFIVTPGKNRFICFCPTCRVQKHGGGDCIELVKRVKDLADYRTAAEFIAQVFHAQKEEAPKVEPKEEGFDAQKYQAKLQADHPTLKTLKVSSDTLSEFGGGYCSKGVHHGRLALPIHRRDGSIDGFLSVPVYREPADPKEPLQEAVRFFKGYTPPLLFNMHGPKTEMRLCATIMEVLESIENGCDDAVCPLHPLTGDYLISLGQWMKTNNIELANF